MKRKTPFNSTPQRSPLGPRPDKSRRRGSRWGVIQLQLKTGVQGTCRVPTCVTPLYPLLKTKKKTNFKICTFKCTFINLYFHKTLPGLLIFLYIRNTTEHVLKMSFIYHRCIYYIPITPLIQ